MYPHEFELLWRLSLGEALTADELACDVNRGKPAWNHRTGIGVSNQLRRLLRDGYLEHDAGRPRIYRLSAKGRAYIDA